MADDIKAINDQINKLRAELGKNPLTPFDIADLEKAKALLSGLGAEVREMSSDLDYISKSFKDSVNELANQKAYLSDAKKSLNGIASIAQKVTEYRKGESSLNEKQLKNLQSQAKLKFEELKTILQYGKLSKENQREIEKSLEEQERFSNAIEKTIGYQKEVNKEIGLLGTGIGGIAKALSKLGFSDLSQPLTDAIEKTKNARLQIKLNKDAIATNTEEYNKLSNKLGSLTKAEVERKRELKEQNKILESQNEELSTQTNKYKNIAKALTDQLTKTNLIDFAFNSLADAIKSVDESTGKLAKNLNISANDALELQRELNAAANTSNTLSITTKGLGEALMAVNSQLGIFNTTIDKNLISFEQLNKTAGLTYDELSGVYKITSATGGDLEANTKEIMAQARVTGQKYKVALNEKEVLKDISKVSAATTLSLGKSGAAIANAVSTAKALGMELSQVDGIAESLLNFEQSIENELSAELLLNKDLNLEKARQAALNNDLATVASEIAKQAGSAAEFAEMNRIQQDALAKAVGMNREELAKTLFTQEQIGNLTGEEYELREKQINDLEAKGLSQAQIKEELGKKSLDDLKNQNSIQEKLNQSVDKMKELFVSIAIPVMQIVTPIVDLLIPAVEILGYVFEGIGATLNYIISSVTGFYDLLTGANTELGLMQSMLGAIVIAYGAIAAYNATAAGFATIRAAMEKNSEKSLISQGLAQLKNLGVSIADAVAKITGASASTLGIAAGIALAAGATAYAFLSSKKGDDIASLGDNSSGYGKRTLLGPEGAIALNNKDTVLAGTNLFPKNNNSGGGTNTVIQQDNTETKRTNMLLEKIANQSPVFKIGTDEFFTSTSKYSYQVQ